MSFTTTDKVFTERSSHDQEKTRSERQPKNRSEIQDGDIPRCDNHPSSKTWECNNGKKGISPPKTSNKLAGGETKDQNPLGCIHCFSNPKLRKNSLNHFLEECKLKPGGGKYKQSPADRSQASINSVQLKAAIREVLNEPAEKKRPREDKEEGSNDQPKNYKKKGKQ